MNKKFIFLIIGMFLLSLTFVSAESIGTFHQGQAFNITNYCQDGGCTGIDLISIQSPNGTSQIINQPMTMIGQKGFYEFNSSEIGTYYFTTTASNGITNVDSFNIDGGNPIFFIIAFILAFGITGFGLKIKHEWVTLAGTFLMLILGIYTSLNGIGIYKNNLTTAISYITILLGLGLGFETLRELTYY